MKKILLLSLGCAFLFTACKRNDDGIDGSSTIAMHYQQTYCADNWGYGDTDNATLLKLRSYLDRNNLYHINETIVQEGGPDFCGACQCHTGKMIYVRILPVQRQEYLTLGFLD